MLFKQKVCKEEKIKFWIIIACIVIPYAILAIVGFINHDDFNDFILLFAVLLPIFLLILLIELQNLEWYCIYDDHIDVRNIYHIKNSVYYDKVSSIKEKEFNLTTRGMQKTFYVFDDGRKDNKVFGIDSCYNNRKFNLIVYKTKKLEDYIANTLKIKVVVEENK